MREPLAYFITFSTYGTWLHGRSPGSVDRRHNQPGMPWLPPSPEREAARRAQKRQAEYVLDEQRRTVVLQTILEVARHRGWKVWALHVRSNHVHAVVSAAARPEKVMADFKAWASRRLREQLGEEADRDRWTQHGSTRYLWDERAVAEKIAYTLDGQGEPMARYEGRTASETASEPEASATAVAARPVADASGSEKSA